jgi:predicted amidohydrolase YtcJ
MLNRFCASLWRKHSVQSGAYENHTPANFVLLSRDIFKIDPKEIESVKVVITMVDGRVVYEERE